MLRLEAQRYFFGLRWSKHEEDDPNGTLLPDNAAALNYADRLVLELKEGNIYNDPNLMVIVRDGMKRGRAFDTFPCSVRLMLHPSLGMAHGADQWICGLTPPTPRAAPSWQFLPHRRACTRSASAITFSRALTVRALHSHN
jgi:hypothetical protein